MEKQHTFDYMALLLVWLEAKLQHKCHFGSAQNMET